MKRGWFLLVGLLLLGGCGNKSAPVHSKPPKRVAVRAMVRSTPRISKRSYFTEPIYYRNGVVVLMYHDFGPRTVYDTITPRRFSAELHALREAHINVIPMSRFARFLDGRESVPPNAVVITMDDGRQGVYRYAFPILERYNDPATLFIIVGWVGRHPHTLTWPELDRLAASPLITVGSHTYDSHGLIQTGPRSWGPALLSREYDPRTGRTETESEYEARVLSDLKKARDILETRYHRPVPYFAFPFGYTSPTLDRLLHAAGYRYLFTTRGWVNRAGEDPDRIYRINAGNFRVNARNLVPTIIGIGRLH